MLERERLLHGKGETHQEWDGRIRREYGWLYDEVMTILFHHDPIGLNFEVNLDEYSPEARTILPRLAEADSVAHLRRIIYEEFEYWLGDRSSDLQSIYDDIAEDVWAVYQNWLKE